MKSVIKATAVLFVIVIICIASYFSGTGFSSSLSYNIEKTKDAVLSDDYNSATEYISLSLKELEEKRLLLCAISNHKEIGDIKTRLLKLRLEAENEKKDASLSDIIEIKELLTRYYNGEMPSIENIF